MRSSPAPFFWKFGRRLNPPPLVKKGGTHYGTRCKLATTITILCTPILCARLCVQNHFMCIKISGQNPKIPPFLESKMSPPFIGLSGKQKYWMTLLTNLYINSTHEVSSFFKNIYQSGEMQTWYNAFKYYWSILWKMNVR